MEGGKWDGTQGRRELRAIARQVMREGSRRTDARHGLVKRHDAVALCKRLRLVEVCLSELCRQGREGIHRWLVGGGVRLGELLG
jgi:hypothetical protein